MGEPSWSDFYREPGKMTAKDRIDAYNAKVKAAAEDFSKCGAVEPAKAATPPKTLLPAGDAERKAIPVCSGVLDYFPSALIEVAKVSKTGNDQHNPGEPLHWARGKSMQQDDTMLRHFLERGTIDQKDGLRHSAKLAWRALALLQLELEAAGAPRARGAWEDTPASARAALYAEAEHAKGN